MKQAKPRRQQPLLFSLWVGGREVTIVDFKDRPLTFKEWHEAMRTLQDKGVMPRASPKENIKLLLEKGL